MTKPPYNPLNRDPEPSSTGDVLVILAVMVVVSFIFAAMVYLVYGGF